MKVFTVGLEQKPPLEDAKSEKSDSPPPGYSHTESRIPLPLGPEMPRAPMPPQPIIVRKSRGYKGILLVMMAVFLMAVFALVLSEMAYNRQREESFLKLRWAELKHRMGYEAEAGPMEYYQRAAASIGDKFDRMLTLAKSNELNQQQPIVPQSLSAEEEPASTSSAPPTPEPVVAIDSFPIAPGSGGSSSSRSSQASFEIEPPQPPPMFGQQPLGGALGQFRDARLQFLRNILQKIKQHAEDIGFDGTMQVSIIEVEPQQGQQGEGSDSAPAEAGNSLNGIWPQQQRQLVQQPAIQFPAQQPQFFPNARPLVDDFKNSRSFLDGFGEFHQPSFMQNNQVEPPSSEDRPRMFGPWAQQPHDFPPPPPPPMMQNGPSDFGDNVPRWLSPRMNNGFRQSGPDVMFFHPIFPPQMSFRFPPPAVAPFNSDFPPQQQQQQNAIGSGILSRPSAFDRWNGLQQQPQQQAMMPQPMMPTGELQQQQQMQQQQQQQMQQQQQLPQQVQIDFPEVKLPPPVISDSTEDKFPVAPPNQQQQQPQQQQQGQQQQKPDWLPKWLIETPSVAVNNAGPPAQHPPPADMVKFPSVTVLEPANQQLPKAVADNENRQGNSDEQQPEGKVIDSAQGETGENAGQQQQPGDEVVEVDAAPQQSEQQQPSQQDQLAVGPDQQVKAQQQQQQGGQQQQQPAEPQSGTIQLQKWFPEVPSVFFQVDDPTEQQQPSAAAQQQQGQQAPEQQQGQAEH